MVAIEFRISDFGCCLKEIINPFNPINPNPAPCQTPAANRQLNPQHLQFHTKGG